MADRLKLPDPDLSALASGTVIVAFVPRHSVGLNDEVDLVSAGPRPGTELSPRHAGLAGAAPPTGDLSGLVVGLQPAASLAGPAGSGHHILASVPEGDVAIMRVFAADGPVLDDAAFAARREAIEAMFT